MSAIDDFIVLLEATEVMKQVIRSLREEPAHLLRDVCEEYQETGRPVPDHHLQFVGYLGEAAIKALIALGLVQQKPGERVSLYAYEPTEAGLKQYEQLKADGFYKKG